MKHLRIIGLAVVAAAALAAFAGGGTASADQLCTETEVNRMCPEGKLITTIEATQVGTLKFTDTPNSVLNTCSGGDLHLGKISQGTLVFPITATVEKLVFTTCTATLTVIKGGTISAVQGAGGGTTLTSIGAEWTIGIFGTTCTYGTGTGKDLGEVNTKGELPVNAVVNPTAGGFLCPETIRWVANFKITNHTALHYIVN